jgi:hypothetical protein
MAVSFVEAEAKRSRRSQRSIRRDVGEAEKIGGEMLAKIAGTPLDKPGEIAALAAMDEQERQEIVDRGVAGCSRCGRAGKRSAWSVKGSASARRLPAVSPVIAGVREQADRVAVRRTISRCPSCLMSCTRTWRRDGLLDKAVSHRAPKVIQRGFVHNEVLEIVPTRQTGAV